MRLYNTLTKQKEDFIPFNGKKVKMYICGPTVYNYIHIGNARPPIVFDTLRRYLIYKGYDVTYVQNFTDVDDKIIAKANVEQVSTDTVTEKYINAFMEEIKGLNILRADYYPRVTEEIPAIIEMVETLVNKGFAYEKNGTVYFNAAKFKEYGKLSKKKLEDLEAGARVEYDTEKINPTDFVLWKPAKPNEPKWESPWGDGRPGWHIECSAMAKKYLGETIDIHAGGEDLVFPHHENEVAQSECANGCEFARNWLHVGMINVDNQKMSKSKGNFFLLREIAEEFSYELVRFYILSVHYKKPVNFSHELMQAAENGLDRIRNAYRLLTEKLEDAKDITNESEDFDKLKEFKSDFQAAMDDDLNTANAITVLFDMAKFINTNINADSSKKYIETLKSALMEIADVLGLEKAITTVKSEVTDNNETAEIESLIAERQQARASKNWALADKIRDDLISRGIEIKDTPEGVKWFRK